MNCLLVPMAALLILEFRLVSCDNTTRSLKANNAVESIVRQEATQHINSCPPWSYYDKLHDTCKCYDRKNKFPVCEQNGKLLSILKNHCITYDAEKGVASAGECIYLHPSYGYYYTVEVFNYSELNEAVCGQFNRKGLLCSECADGMYISSYSYRVSCISTCKPSTVNWIKYFLITLVLTTIFYSILFLFKINVHSSRLQGCIFLIQFAASPVALRTCESYLRISGTNTFRRAIMISGTIVGIWNLDFFRVIDNSICLGLTPLGQLSLDFFTILYTLLMIIGTYLVMGWHDKQARVIKLVCKPLTILKSFRENRNISNSTIDSLATFLILSNIKVLNVCLDILKPLRVYQLTKGGGHRWSVFYDPKLSYFGKDHLPHAIFALFMLAIFVIVPIAILLLYPSRWFQKFLTKLPSRKQIFLKILVDSFQGIYKDGTEPNTRDFRWFSAFPFIVRLVIMFLYMYSLDSFFLVNGGIVLSIAVMLIIIIDPYKNNVKYISTDFAVFLLITAAILVSMFMSSKMSITANFSEFTLLLTIIVIALYFIFLLIRLRVCGSCPASVMAVLKRKLC